MTSPSPYNAWSKNDLIARIQSLERVLTDSVPASKIPLPQKNSPTHPNSTSSTPRPISPKNIKRAKQPKPFDFGARPRRKIALKFCYSGWEYNGLAFQKEPTPLPMVEAVLLEALATTRLIDGEKGMEGCGWSRCGRTDKGVSGAGQVVALWVRSAVGLKKMKHTKMEAEQAPSSVVEDGLTNAVDELADNTPKDGVKEDSITSALDDTLEPELRYVHMLNSVLPASIRILAWSPVADDFDARFSCQYRHYKYFFTPGIPPRTPGAASLAQPLSIPSSPANLSALDIPAMQDAASRLVGEHDFRNFCKIDPSKQIENYKRTILLAAISPLDPFDLSSVPNYPLHDSVESRITSPVSLDQSIAPIAPAYVFDLIGNGFLWHQVRHIMAILFHVGARVEAPSIIDALFNVDEENPLPPLPISASPTPQQVPLVPTKPHYEMADGLPLVLWDCDYPPDDVEWRTDDGADHQTKGNSAGEAIHLDLRQLSERNMVKFIMQNHFAKAAGVFHPLNGLVDNAGELLETGGNQSDVAHDPVRIPMGAGSIYQSNRYIPLLNRPRGEKAELSNERWRTGAGARKMERKAAAAESLPTTGS